jgi:hypothetical protein
MATQPRGRRDLSLTPTSDAELDDLAEVSPSDAQRADLEWRVVAPKDMKEILQAQVVE